MKRKITKTGYIMSCELEDVFEDEDLGFYINMEHFPYHKISDLLLDNTNENKICNMCRQFTCKPIKVKFTVEKLTRSRSQT